MEKIRPPQIDPRLVPLAKIVSWRLCQAVVPALEQAGISLENDTQHCITEYGVEVLATVISEATHRSFESASLVIAPGTSLDEIGLANTIITESGSPQARIENGNIVVVFPGGHPIVTEVSAPFNPVAPWKPETAHYILGVTPVLTTYDDPQQNIIFTTSKPQ